MFIVLDLQYRMQKKVRVQGRKIFLPLRKFLPVVQPRCWAVNRRNPLPVGSERFPLKAVALTAGTSMPRFRYCCLLLFTRHK